MPETLTQPATRGDILADLAAQYGEPHELAASHIPGHTIPADLAGGGPVQYVIDVSEHQDVVDMGAVRDSGVPAVIVKVNEGTYDDPKGARNLANAKAAGLVCGAYSYLTHGSSIATQVANFLSLAPHDAIHALDVEAPGPLDPRAWVEEYRRHEPHHPLLVYTGKYLWTQRSQVTYPGSGLGLLWNAGAVPGGYVPGVDETPARSYARVGPQNGGLPYQGWTSWTLLQFSESCRVPGVPSRVDASAFRGSLDQLRALTGQETDMAITDAEFARIRKEVADEVLGRGIQTWDGVRSLPNMTSTTMKYAQDASIGVAGLAASLAGPLATALIPALTAAIKALPGGTTTVDDATIAKVAQATATELATRLVR